MCLFVIVGFKAGSSVGVQVKEGEVLQSAHTALVFIKPSNTESG